MAPINSKDLGQILIKETTADTNDVFDVLIWWGPRVGWRWSMYLTLAFLFIVYQDHLILPLVPLCHHSLVLSTAKHLLSTVSRRPASPPPPPQGELEGLRGCAFMCLHFLWRLLCSTKVKSKRLLRPTMGLWHQVYENQLSFAHRGTFV